MFVLHIFPGSETPFVPHTALVHSCWQHRTFISGGAAVVTATSIEFGNIAQLPSNHAIKCYRRAIRERGSVSIVVLTSY